jgi:hypothetical protein
MLLSFSEGNVEIIYCYIEGEMLTDLIKCFIPHRSLHLNTNALQKLKTYPG